MDWHVSARHPSIFKSWAVLFMVICYLTQTVLCYNSIASCLSSWFAFISFVIYVLNSLSNIHLKFSFSKIKSLPLLRPDLWRSLFDPSSMVWAWWAVFIADICDPTYLWFRLHWPEFAASSWHAGLLGNLGWLLSNFGSDYQLNFFPNFHHRCS